MSKITPQKRQLNGDPWRDFREWSIDIYKGSSPFEMKPVNSRPILTASDVTDVEAAFVADPFMLRQHNQWHMFFEVLEKKTRKGLIAKAVSDNGIDWQYQKIVLKEDYHLSYPFVFEHNSKIYMVPESLGANAIRLYCTADINSPFKFVGNLIEGKWADSTLVFHHDLWWLFSCSTPFQNSTLELYFSKELLGPWQPHPQNPIIIDDKKSARPAGRIQPINNELVRFSQDCVSRYGNKVRAYKILELSTTKYRELAVEKNILEAGIPTAWNAAGMHHIDAHQLTSNEWFACVDGDRYVIPEYLLEQAGLYP